MKIEIKSIYGELIFEGDFSCIAEAVKAALGAKKSLRAADLRFADLRYADLNSADLSSANLSAADLRAANLSAADLRAANLRFANLRSANLSAADLRAANLSAADLRAANLSFANLRAADLSSANLRAADLSAADLRAANLRAANLRAANLRAANLRAADLRYADLSSAKNAALAIAMTRILPPEGNLVGWKKLKCGEIAKLLIPTHAKRSHAFGRKCRASEALVLEIYKDGQPVAGEFAAHYDSALTYSKGKTVTPTAPFDDDFTNECGSGIHFFITREEAEAYIL